MLSAPTQGKIYLCTTPVDLRKGFDGLAGLVEGVLGERVLDGHLFLFVNHRRDRIKALWWDRDGMAIFYKRLERGGFALPTAGAEGAKRSIDATELAMLLGGVSIEGVKRRARYARAG
jgi:transposase